MNLAEGTVEREEKNESKAEKSLSSFGSSTKDIPHCSSVHETWAMGRTWQCAYAGERSEGHIDGELRTTLEDEIVEEVDHISHRNHAPV